MEIKTELKQPYTEQEKITFIVENNHRLGYIIEEREDKLIALGYTEEEIKEQEKQARNAEIDSKIKELQQMALPEILQGNTANVKLYNDVIAGLEMARPSI